jgi:hypothetical protein
MKPGYGYSPVEENPPSLAERLTHQIVLCGSPWFVPRNFLKKVKLRLLS